MKLNSKWAIISFLIFTLPWMGCGADEASADEAAETARDSGSFWSDVKTTFTRKIVQVPAGTKIHIRLDHAIGSAQNESGDHFRAHLYEPIVVEGKVLAPEGTAVTGVLTHVDDSDRVKGRATMTMRLKTMTVDNTEYALKTHPITIEAEGTKKDDAKKIGAGAAIGAVIGAIAGGGDGAAKGAAIGAGAGTGLVLVTKGKEVEFGPESRFAFSLSDSMELPVTGE